MVRRGYADKGYFSGLKMKKNRQAHEERAPFTEKSIKKILIWSDKLEGYRYWMPRLGLYTGCRLNELCQLYKDDVEQIDGVLCLTITDKLEDQRLKNLSSRRVVPMHPSIADDFVKYLRKITGDRVFPELPYTEHSGYGGAASKWFARFRKSLGLNESFHSLRHTFASQLLGCSVERKVISALLGHSDSTETGRYTGGYPVGVLLDAVNKLKFD